MEAKPDEPVLQYKKIFAPGRVHRPKEYDKVEPGDQRKNPVYVYADEIVLAVNVALVTWRPLLVRGAPGTGKSSLARNVADVLGWRYYERVITSHTQARDLLWEVDLLRRLHDAQTPGGTLSEDYTSYIAPGVLWWAFDPESATWRGAAPSRRGVRAGAGGARARPRRVKPVENPWKGVEAPRAVVLLDEIDKADPDVPNNLLVPLGSLQFQVEETGALVTTDAEHAPLVIVTTNEERALPAAFLRRCVEVQLQLPYAGRLLQIGQEHFPKMDTAVIKKVLSLLAVPEEGQDKHAEPVISPAEFIDTLRACDDLEVTIDDTKTWEALAAVTVWKHGRKKKNTR